MESQLTNIMQDLSMVKSDMDVMLKRTKDVSASHLNNLEERLKIKIDDIAKGVVQKTKKLQDEINHNAGIVGRLVGNNRNFEEYINYKVSELNEIVMRTKYNEPLLSDRKIDELTTFVNDINFADKEEDMENINDTIRATFAKKSILTCWHYSRIDHLLQEICDEPLNRPLLVKEFITLIESLPNKVVQQHNGTEKGSENTSSVLLISQNNIISEAIGFHKKIRLTTTDLLETIQSMLKDNKYVLCETFAKSKLNFEEANKQFLSAVAPHLLNKEDLHKLLFT